MKTTNLATVGLFGLLAACGRSGPGDATYSPKTLEAGEKAGFATAQLSAAEMRFGVSPTRNKDVVYQPDVIVMEHGADAIRSQSSNGFTWTLDANAPGASQIQLDKILFATGRVVGRVLRLERNGNDLDVTLGPVELTDIIAEAHIVSHATLDPANMIVYVAPAGYPGTFVNRDAAEADAAVSPSAKTSERSPIRVYTASRSGKLIPLGPMRETPSPACVEDARAPLRVTQAVYFVYGGDEQGGCAQPLLVGSGAPAVADIAAVLLDGFHIFPDVSNGLGIRVPYDKNGMQFLARLNLRLDHPDFTFRLDISHGLKTAAIELSGVGGIDVGIEGGTSGEFKNVNETFAIPVDISFPIPGPLPFAATFHQSLLVQTMFTVKQAVIRANGDYSLGGKITAGIINGTPTGKAPLFLKTTQNLANSLSGVSPGVNGLVLGYGGKLIVGLGAFHLVIGPYASINTTVGITRGSDLQTATVGYTCRSAQLDLALDYGLGFAVPAWTAKALNFALSFFHAKPISASYSTKLGTLPIKSVIDAVPPSCAAAPT